jgi:L-fuculose-phosphate aldolase
MLLQKEREMIVQYGKKMMSSGLTRGTGGNLSIYVRDLELMAIKPSGIPYDEIEPEDVMVMKLDGTIVEGNKTPSSEFAMHAIVYRNREDVGAMLHVHSTFAVTLACLNEDLPAVDYMVAYSRGRRVQCAPYASFGTPELAVNALKTMGNQNAVLLANHGMNVVGPNLPKAFAIAEQLEFCAELYVRSRTIGTPVILPDDEMDKMVERFISAGY